ncbi:MAG: cupin-like domain-containing protein, partial [Wenzhouxiangellaceae bacterium]
MKQAVPPIAEIRDADPARALADVNGRAIPAVLRGLCADWPLVRHAAEPGELQRYLLEHYQGAPVTAFIGAPETEGRIFYNGDISRLDFQQV